MSNFRYLSWADFDASKKKGVNRPFFTYFLLFTCTIALIVSIALNGWKVEQLDINPMIGPSAETLILMGAKDSYLIVSENEVWRVLSSAILHAGLVHYVINCLALWFVGKAIETTHGTLATAIIFIISAIGGTLLSAIFLPEYITVGASGGIFGLIGACLADIMMNWKHLFSDFVTENGRRNSHLLVVVFLILDILLNCLIGLTPYVDNFTRKCSILSQVYVSLFLLEHIVVFRFNLLTYILLSFSFFHQFPRSWRNDVRFTMWSQYNGKASGCIFRYGRRLLHSSKANRYSISWSHHQHHFNHHNDSYITSG